MQREGHHLEPQGSRATLSAVRRVFHIHNRAFYIHNQVFYSHNRVT